MHKPPMLGPVVVKGGEVLDTAVIPHQEIVHLPDVHMPKLGLDHVGSKLIDERQALICGHAFDSDTFTLADIETFVPCIRMCTYDRMHHVWLLRAQGMVLLPCASMCPPSSDLVHGAQALKTCLQGFW
jgi:hypothetical protein